MSDSHTDDLFIESSGRIISLRIENALSARKSGLTQDVRGKLKKKTLFILILLF